MSDVHRRAAASAPRLSPEEIATRGFAASFRGISELEVRNYLRRIADEMTTAQAREDDLAAQIEDLRERVSNPPVVTEDRLLDALGEETARVLRSAQESAEQIRARAAEHAAAALAEADTTATTTREDADTDARAMRDAAQTAAAAREDEATEYATSLRAEVDAEVAQLRAATDAEVTETRESSIAAAAAEIDAAKEAGRDLVNEARAVRERILADLGRRRLLLQAQIDELRAGRDRLLDAYRVVKRTLGDATQALVQVEARAGDELSGPPPILEVPPVDGEMAALAGELTGEAGAPSVEVEALFARLRAQSAPASAEPQSDPVPEPPAAAVVPITDPDPVPAPTRTPAAKPAPARSRVPKPVRTATSVIEVPLPEPVDAMIDVVDPVADEPIIAPSAAETPVAPATMVGSLTDDEARAARSAVLDPLQRELGRKVKRTLQDEQNDVLDRLRTVKGRPTAAEVLPSATEQVAVLAATLRVPLDAAFAGGRHAVGAHDGATTAPAAMIDGLAAAMVERLHERLVDAIDDAGSDEAALTQRLGARYREFKGQSLDAVVGDTLAAAWALGVYDAAPTATVLRWVPSEVGTCPDCDDNSLEPTVRGEAFPTGQLHPPAHPGCRCLLVPVW
ncbi:MAG: DivIVA domain-containing protein [Acidimicrobiia bacterium]